MQDVIAPPLVAWESFYVIVGSSGAALTGLQFVVIALVAEVRRRDTGSEPIDAFGTPTIVHFCTVLLLSAILSAPWHELASVALGIGAIGLAGIVYDAIVVRRANRQTGYTPVMEDWIWHTILPLLSHSALLGSAIGLLRGAVGALFPIAAVSLMLLFIGIHNAWDSVVYIALDMPPTEQPER